MRCPYCRTPLRETTPECPGCQLTLPRATGILGPVPRLSPRVSDSGRLLKPRALRQIRQAIAEMQRRLPQVHFHAVIREMPTDHPFDLYLFWLFNTGGFSEEADKGGENRSIVLLIDPANHRSGLTIGYGLEPFLSADVLDHLLEMTDPLLAQEEYGRAILQVIDSLTTALTAVCEELPEALGLSQTLATQADEAEF